MRAANFSKQLSKHAEQLELCPQAGCGKGVWRPQTGFPALRSNVPCIAPAPDR